MKLGKPKVKSFPNKVKKIQRKRRVYGSQYGNPRRRCRMKVRTPRLRMKKLKTNLIRLGQRATNKWKMAKMKHLRTDKLVTSSLKQSRQAISQSGPLPSFSRTNYRISSSSSSKTCSSRKIRIPR